MKKTSPVLTALRKATRGLQFLSETESKLHPFVWDTGGTMDEQKLLSLADYEYPEGTPVEKTTLERFFRAVLPEAKEPFDQLAATLKEQLSDLRVYKVGETEKDVYIVGKTPDGHWAGLLTTVVET